MAWTAPRTWVALEVPTAAVMNQHIRDNLAFLPRPLFVSGGEVDVRNNGTDVELLGCTVPANGLGDKGCLRGTLIGDYVNSTQITRNLTFRLKLGATTLWDDTGGAFVATGTRHNWVMKFVVGKRTGVDQVFVAGAWNMGFHGNTNVGNGDLSHYSPGADGPAMIPFGTTGVAAQSLAAATTLSLIVNAPQPSAAQLHEFRCEWACVELIGQAL